MLESYYYKVILIFQLFGLWPGLLLGLMNRKKIRIVIMRVKLCNV